MKHKILAPTILFILFVSSSFITNASEPEPILPLADTYVDAFESTEPHGNRDYLEISDYASGFSIALLMFDISRALNVPSEVKLRLYCFSVAYPHIVGVHWCVNNTWNEENLTSVSFGGFLRTNPESVVKVDSFNVWYEWKVTDFVTKAIEEEYERITLTLEVEDPLEGTALSRFASKDQPTQKMREYGPQLVFTYFEAYPLDAIIVVGLGLMATITIVFLAYKFLKTRTRPPKRKTGHRKVHVRI